MGAFIADSICIGQPARADGAGLVAEIYVLLDRSCEIEDDGNLEAICEQIFDKQIELCRRPGDLADAFEKLRMAMRDFASPAGQIVTEGGILSGHDVLLIQSAMADIERMAAAGR